MRNQKTRHKKIIDFLQNNQELEVSQACEIFNVSPATIRRDFNVLVGKENIKKTWGGLSLDTKMKAGDEMSSIALRKSLNAAEKKKIAEKAASFVKDGDVIIIDGGTTTYFMIPFLANKNIRVITNSILIAYFIDKDRQNKFGGAEVFLTGGIIYPNSELLVGPQSIANLKEYHADWAFLSVGGIEMDFATNSNQLVVETEKAMIEQSEKVVMLADSSKFGKKSMTKICDLNKIDIIITNQNGNNMEMLDKLKAKNVNIIAL